MDRVRQIDGFRLTASNSGRVYQDLVKRGRCVAVSPNLSLGDTRPGSTDGQARTRRTADQLSCTGQNSARASARRAAATRGSSAPTTSNSSSSRSRTASRSSPAVTPHRVDEPTERVLDMAADQVEVGGGDLRLRVARLLGGRPCAPAAGPAPCTRCEQLGLGEAQFGLGVARVVTQHVLVRLHRTAEVARVQGLYGGFEQRVVRAGRDLRGRRDGRRRARRPGRRRGRSARSAARRPARAGRGSAGSAPRRRPPGRGAAPARRRRRRRPGCPGSRTAASASGWRRHRSWRGRTRPSYSTASRSSTGLSCLQGWHHSAQKSMTTGTSVDRCRTSRSNPASSTSMTRSAGETAPSAALPGRFGARLLRLRLGLLGRLHRGEVDDSAHGHVPWLHASILPLPRARVKSDPRTSAGSPPAGVPAPRSCTSVSRRPRRRSSLRVVA